MPKKQHQSWSLKRKRLPKTSQKQLGPGPKFCRVISKRPKSLARNVYCLSTKWFSEQLVSGCRRKQRNRQPNGRQRSTIGVRFLRSGGGFRQAKRGTMGPRAVLRR